MAKAWKITNGTGYSYIRYDQPTNEHLAHYAAHNVKVEEIEIKGPVVKLYYAIVDGGDGSHSVHFFPSQEAINERYDDEGFEKGEDAYQDVPAEIDHKYVDLSDYEVIK